MSMICILAQQVESTGGDVSLSVIANIVTVGVVVVTAVVAVMNIRGSTRELAVRVKHLTEAIEKLDKRLGDGEERLRHLENRVGIIEGLCPACPGASGVRVIKER